MKKIFFLLLTLIFVINCYSQTEVSYLRRGEDKLISKDYKGAIVEFSKAIEFNTDTHTQTLAYYHRGLAKQELEDYRGAIADYTKAIALFPSSFTYNSRAFVKFALEDYRGAIADYDKVLQISPKFSEAFYYRGVSKLFLGLKDSGCLDLSKAGELGYEHAYDSIKEFCN